MSLDVKKPSSPFPEQEQIEMLKLGSPNYEFKLGPSVGALCPG